MSNKTFVWKGKELNTLGDIVDAASALKSRKQGAAFMAAYLKFTPHAYGNIGYAAGYCDAETQDRIYEFTETAHPIFGRHHPTPDEALAAGMRIAQSETNR